MDIFTTVLTRVVPNKIKPAQMKVKALTKEQATMALSDDIDHLEHHETLAELNERENKENEKKPQISDSKQQQLTNKENDQEVLDEDKPHHLDIYV